MIWKRGLIAVVASLAFACGGQASEPEAEPSSGAEVEPEPPADEEVEDEPRRTNVHALPDDASEPLHQAEWLREEQVRLGRALQIHLGRADISCPSARDAREEICLVTERICDLVDEDAAVESRCAESREKCEAARAAVADGGC